MRRPVVMPEIGTTRAVVSAWFVQPGERVYAGDRLVEVLIGGATIDVSAGVDGTLLEKAVRPEQPVAPGQILGYLDED